MAEIPSLLFLLPLLLSYVSFSSSSTIRLGSVLYASNPDQSWSSSNSAFSVSFVPTASSGSFLAAIVFAGNVSVWSAGTVDSGGSLRLLPSGSLRLLNGSGATVWDSGSDRLGVVSASLEDSGNLVLLDNRSITVWSSFDHPTDTIVQLQNFTVGKVLRSGSYSFQLLESGNFTLRWNKSIIYWNQGLNSSLNSNLSSPSFSLQTNGVVMLFGSTLPGGVRFIYSSDYGEDGNAFRFLRLDTDGNLRIYSAASSNSGPVTVQWNAVGDLCLVYGYCGNFGICSYNDSNPICSCPSLNFEPVDVNDTRKGCKRKVELRDCSGNATMLGLDQTRLLTYLPDPNLELFFMGNLPCRSNCLVSSSCLASVSMSDGSGICWQKHPGSFFTGYQTSSISSTSYVKVCGPVLPNPSLGARKSDENSKVHLWVLAVVVIAALLGLVAIEGGLWWWCCRNSTQFGTMSAHYTLLEYASGAPVQFSFKELQRCTKGFKEKLGAGGFGAVYKGLLANRTAVAVKQLEGIEQGEKQFRMEVATISSTHHLNLVRLIGFCSEGRHRLLVYEFMKNGSLDNCLFTSDSGKLLTWEYRFNIALGTAKGITYLHEECRDCIVHCDIKPENILLDDNYTAKVSDFGLAKLLNPKDNRYRNLSSIRGTRGYLAPEWLANHPITAKSDVYSYGMVLLEIVSGRRNFDISEEANRKKFSIWAYEEFEKGNTEAILDKRLRTDQTVDMEQVKRMVQASFWCTQEKPTQRPTMGKVVQMLEGITEITKPPAPKALREVPVAGHSLNSSTVSTLGASAPPVPSSSSSSSATVSSHTGGGSSSMVVTRKNNEGTSSLLRSEFSKKSVSSLY
ncbi:PREDICTED: G-type lectin S-receptor-like serine/threonine-protein kinase At1g34300 [Tarenaya hassleriana]|uniref:G-type lectin S-receptor-like serine/threonine-protein kinase At1g34300 n=1 Tax=Tarenaya hassleriana TaxID=28532 RepID=UPI00053C8B6B|nr:PREDICTED: G-type lectin S-receptor-like serine/threonine-protein kinase At1g34300 [Tarenaya hassleriana]